MSQPMDSYDAFLSHAWGPDSHGRDNHATVARVCAGLQERGLTVWFDDQQMHDSIAQQMVRGIDAAAVMVTFLTQAYCEKVNSPQVNNCLREWNFAVLKCKPMAAVPMEDALLQPQNWPGVVAAELGAHLFEAKFSPSATASDAAFAQQIEKLASWIKRLAPKRPDPAGRDS